MAVMLQHLLAEVAADGLNSGIRGLCLRQSRNEVVAKIVIVARLKNDVRALRRELTGKNQKSPESSADRPSRTKATEPANPKSRRFCPMCEFLTANDMAKSAPSTIERIIDQFGEIPVFSLYGLYTRENR
jgi:hypothetical protein